MLMAEFGTKLLTLPQIFNNNIFSIPDYQRGYSWEKKQIEEMLRDIEHLFSSNQNHLHYTGTLVFSRPPSKSRYDIVDGQQRLTTLVILLAEIHKLLDKKNSRLKKLYLLRGAIGSEQTVLHLNSDVRSLFDNFIIEDKPLKGEKKNLQAHKRLVDAKKLIREWLNNKIKQKTSLNTIIDVTEKKLGFIVFSPKGSAETGIMFEVINNRGKDLSELEKVKNYLIYCSVKLSATTLREEINSSWSSILINLNNAKKTSLAEEGAFLRYCMVVYFQLSKQDSQFGYDQIKKEVNLEKSISSQKQKYKIIEKIRNFIQFLKLASSWYDRLFGRNHANLNQSLIVVLDQIRGQEAHASIMPSFLAFVTKENLHQKRLTHLLKLLEALNFRVYMSRGITNRNDSGQAYLYHDAAKFYHNKLMSKILKEEYPEKIIKSEEDAIEIRLVQFIIEYAPDEKFITSLELEKTSNDDFYKWKGLRYFLMNYEQHLQPNKTISIDKIIRSRKEGKSLDYLSVEHSWATENRAGDGQNNRFKDKFQKRRLGNFILLELRLNIQGYKYDLDEKLSYYFNGDERTELMQVHKLKELANEAYANFEQKRKRKGKDYYLDLHEFIFNKVEENYKAFAVERWSVKNYLGYNNVIEWHEAD